MTMAAVATLGAGGLCRRAAGIGPRLFRATGFHQKTTLVAHPLYSSITRRITLSRASKRIQSHVSSFIPPQRFLRLVTLGPYNLDEYADPATVSVQY
jgi:hypothetical protein